MLRWICIIIGLVLLLILIPMFFRGTGAMIMLIFMLGILAFGSILVSRILKTAVKKSVSIYGRQADKKKQAEEPVSEEDREFCRIYAGKARIPADARSRSDYIQWLMKKGHYEEADRVQSLLK